MDGGSYVPTEDEGIGMEEQLSFFGIPYSTAPTVPMEHRCWSCDDRRIHDDCRAGLCQECCDRLKDPS